MPKPRRLFPGELRSATTPADISVGWYVPTVTLLPLDADNVMLSARSFGEGATRLYWRLCPYLVVVFTTTDLMSAGTTLDLSEWLQDGDVNTYLDLSNFGVDPTYERLYIGSSQRFVGVWFELPTGHRNLNTGSLTVQYWNGSSWVTPSDVSDGTNFFQTSGLISADSLSTNDWTLSTLATATGRSPLAGPLMIDPLGRQYWLRIIPSTEVSADTWVTEIKPWVADERYAAMTEQMDVLIAPKIGVGGYIAVQAKTDTGTASMVVQANRTRSESAT